MLLRVFFILRNRSLPHSRWTRLKMKETKTMNDLYILLETAQRYLSIRDGDETTMRPSIDLPDAFSCGYLISLHKTRTYSPALSLEGVDLVEHLKGDINDLPVQIKKYCHSYLFAADVDYNGTYNKPTVPKLRNAFICGYCAALHKISKYDPVLALTGHLQITHIMSELLLFQKKIKDAMRAQARILVNTYGVKNKDAYRTILLGGYIDKDGKLFDTDGHRINDDGVPCDEYGNPINAGDDATPQPEADDIPTCEPFPSDILV